MIVRAPSSSRRMRAPFTCSGPRVVSNGIMNNDPIIQLSCGLIAADVRRTKENRGDQKSRPRHNYAQSGSNSNSNLNADNTQTSKRPITSYYTPTTSSSGTTTTTTTSTERSYYNNNYNSNYNNNDDSKRKQRKQWQL